MRWRISFPWHWHRTPTGNGIAHVRSERRAAEERLRRAEEDVIAPLREMRRRNHVGETISSLIQQKTAGGHS